MSKFESEIKNLDIYTWGHDVGKWIYIGLIYRRKGTYLGAANV